jgi:hypothetical protein
VYQGNYEKWHPLSELSNKKFYCDSLTDNLSILKIVFQSEDGMGNLAVKFDSHCLYASSNESFRYITNEMFPAGSFPHLFWRVKDSALVSEFHRQSQNIYLSAAITHYVFASVEDVIDVLSKSEPTLDCSWLK